MRAEMEFAPTFHDFLFKQMGELPTISDLILRKVDTAVENKVCVKGRFQHTGFGWSQYFANRTQLLEKLQSVSLCQLLGFRFEKYQLSLRTLKY